MLGVLLWNVRGPKMGSEDMLRKFDCNILYKKHEGLTEIIAFLIPPMGCRLYGHHTDMPVTAQLRTSELQAEATLRDSCRDNIHISTQSRRSIHHGVPVVSIGIFINGSYRVSSVV